MYQLLKVSSLPAVSVFASSFQIKKIYALLNSMRVAVCLVLAGSMLYAYPSFASKKVRYYYTDPQGTVLAITDGAGVAQQEPDYDPYGFIANGYANGAWYAGHVVDDDTGLVYMQARYYDPVSGRFLSGDPLPGALGSPLAFSRYSYAESNPLRYTDPTGGATRSDGDSFNCEVYHCQKFSSSSGFEGDTPATMNRMARQPLPETINTRSPGVEEPSKLEASEYESDAPYLAQLAEVAQLASQSVSGVPQPLRGTLVHIAFAELVRELPMDGFRAEVSYVNKFPAPYGFPGSSRADAVYGGLLRPRFVVDLKTGNAAISAAQRRRYEINIPSGTRIYVIYVP